ncbi:HAD family hydrolase [Deinococcus koreensis]|uniref:HAD family hydrolase n=1 Tax=Deinococcus koreensis TaxID=2054903 RepID=A0A2K3V176_9DEIO|nr:HAD family hydrolase [Deinococcus koreensis]PNY82533.1 HAD family hydrolase [Deinococcus koreensis]
MRVILFDLDGTLHDRAATIQIWLEGHLRRFDLPSGYGVRFLELDDFGYRSKQDVMPQLVQEFGLEHHPDALCADFWTRVDSAQAMPHAHTVLRALRERGVRIGVVTNGWEELQTRSLEACGLRDLVDDVVISRAVGLSKPDPAIHRLALERLDAPAGDCWFVGDSPRNDVWGPQQIGLRAAFLNTGHALGAERPDAVLDDLRNVLGLG